MRAYLRPRLQKAVNEAMKEFGSDLKEHKAAIQETDKETVLTVKKSRYFFHIEPQEMDIQTLSDIITILEANLEHALKRRETSVLFN